MRRGVRRHAGSTTPRVAAVGPQRGPMSLGSAGWRAAKEGEQRDKVCRRGPSARTSAPRIVLMKSQRSCTAVASWCASRSVRFRDSDRRLCPRSSSSTRACACRRLASAGSRALERPLFLALAENRTQVVRNCLAEPRDAGFRMLIWTRHRQGHCTTRLYHSGSPKPLILLESFVHQPLREGLVPRRGLDLNFLRASNHSH